MSKNCVRVLLVLPLALLLVGSHAQPTLAKGKQTAATTKAENACIKEYGGCVKNTCSGSVYGEKGSAGYNACEAVCGSELNACLNNIKTISADPASQKQKVKQNPAAATQPATSNKGGTEKVKQTSAAAEQPATPNRGGADRQGMQRSGRR